LAKIYQQMAYGPGFHRALGGLECLAQSRWYWLFTITSGPGQQQLKLSSGDRSKAVWIDRLALGDATMPLRLQAFQQGLTVPILAQSPEIIPRPSFDLTLAVSKQQLGAL
jgi:hypothetical protein